MSALFPTIGHEANPGKAQDHHRPGGGLWNGGHAERQIVDGEIVEGLELKIRVRGEQQVVDIRARVDRRSHWPLGEVKCPQQAVAGVEGEDMKGRGPKEERIEVERDRFTGTEKLSLRSPASVAWCWLAIKTLVDVKPATAPDGPAGSEKTTPSAE